MAYARPSEDFARSGDRAAQEGNRVGGGTKRWQDLGLALRAARRNDGDALQAYVRRLSQQSRYNRFLGGASELPASELARALAANGRDTLTLLLTSRVEGYETVVGEARVALFLRRTGRRVRHLDCRRMPAAWRRLGGAAGNRAQSRARWHRMALRRYVVDQQGYDLTGARPRLSGWIRARTAARATSEAAGRRSFRPAVPEMGRYRGRCGDARCLIGEAPRRGYWPKPCSWRCPRRLRRTSRR
jgi:hypothetical protein